MRRALTVFALVLGLPLTVAACLWDRDTPAEEAQGIPEVVAAITGRFPRNPSLYYEMRLKRVTAHLQGHPEDLAAYDDAGVACDRLGRGDEAIVWMEKKRARLDTLDASRPEVKEQFYRYHANLGTFLVHRWIKQGADRAKIDQVKSARDEIARALEINPDAHFGREKYQLQALEWIIDPPKVMTEPNPSGYERGAKMLGVDRAKPPTPEKARDAVRGWSGLIVLGNAWESVDVFNALMFALAKDSIGFPESEDAGRNSLASLARWRCLELINEGKGSMLPGSPKGEDLEHMLFHSDYLPGDELKATYTRLRAEAETWQAARTAFLMKRLEEGRHPDTDPRFWDGYVESPAPELPDTRNGTAGPRMTPARIARGGAIVCTVIALMFGVLWVMIRSVFRLARIRPAEKSSPGFGG